MKTMKVALLATAALAAVSVSARADDAAAIKAQLEALTARIAQLEAGPALPAGYSLLTVSEVAPLTLTGEKAADVANTRSHRISVLPTADVPAATTIDWDIEIRAALTHYMGDTNSEDDTMINARGRVRVKASTETAVGTVGVDVRFQGSSDFGGGAYTYMNIAWGWWQMTPDWTFGGGYTGSLSDPGHGMDGWATFGTTIGYGQGDQEQFRLTWASGPLTWAVALEDNYDASYTEHTNLAVASRLDYAGDAFSASLSGYYGPADYSNYDDQWQVAAGADFGLGDMATISVNGAIGDRGGFITNDDYASATAFVSFDLTEAASIEFSAGHVWNDASADFTKYNAGIYWKPADQLKIGVQADHTDVQGGSTADWSSAALVAWFTY